MCRIEIILNWRSITFDQPSVRGIFTSEFRRRAFFLAVAAINPNQTDIEETHS